jgi:predicted house-cleaning noncanonical NTP pyrophosphatase (MazG superfamily)
MSGRLVRDRIGDIAWQDESGKRFLRPVKNKEEHISLLYRKLLEEVGELITAHTSSELIEEMGDVFEVLNGLISVLDLDPESLRQVANAKFSYRGGFTKGTVWEGNS